MGHDGWVKIHRRLLDHPVWTSGPFSRGQAWIDLILLTNHKPGHIRKQGARIELCRGDCGWSEVELGKRWGWSRGKVRRFLDELENDKMLSKKRYNERDTRTCSLTITNYTQFQGNEDGDGTGDGTGDGQATVQATDRRRYKNKNEKNVKNEKKEPETGIDPEFIQFWTAYPRKLKKADALKAWQRAMRKPPIDYILEQLEKWKASGDWTKEGGRYVPHPTTWINGERWNDEPYGYGSTGYNWREEEDRPKDWSTVPNSDWILEDWPGDTKPQ